MRLNFYNVYDSPGLYMLEKLYCNSSFSPCFLRKNKEKISPGVAEQVLVDENLSFQDEPNKRKYQAEIERYLFI